MTSRSGGEHDSLFRLPLSGDLLASKVAQIDDAIQYVPLVGSSAWKEIRISFRAAVAGPRAETAVMTNIDAMIPQFFRWLIDYWTNGGLTDAFSLETSHRRRHLGHDTTRSACDPWSMNDERWCLNMLDRFS